MLGIRGSILSSLAGLALCAGFAAPAAAASAPTAVYTVPAPAAILVVLPGAMPLQWRLAPAPALWPSEGIAASMPAAVARLIADQEAELARLSAASEALAAAPERIWESMLAEMPRLGPTRASGVVMTAIATGRGSCSETVTYAYPGNGMAPRVTVRKSGNACPAGSLLAPGAEPSIILAARAHAPRLLETAAPPDRLIPAAPVPQTELVSYPPVR
jgi:hypothetical protein